jgi:hypothetical protein
MCLENNPHASYFGSYEELYYPYWGCEVWATWQKKGATALLQKGEANSDYTLGTCNLVNFTIFNLSEPNWEVEQAIGILIDGRVPGTLLHSKLITVTHESSSHQIFHSFMRRCGVSFLSLSRPKTCSFH